MAVAHDIKVVVVERIPVGQPVVQLSNANVTSVNWELNGIGSMSFDLPTDDRSSAPAILNGLRGLLLKREVQLWVDGVLRWWGVPVRASATTAQVTVQCMGLLWYFSRLNYGPVLQNYIANASFESSSLAPWEAVRTTATIDGTRSTLGLQSVKLVAGAGIGEDGPDSYLVQRTLVTTSADQPRFYAPKAWYYLPNASFVGPAFEERGLMVLRLDTAGNVLEVGEVDPIAESDERDKWIRLETGISVPAASTQIVEVRLYCPNGTIFWDATGMFVEESVSAAAGGDDARAVIQRAVEYAQDEARGKTNLGIGFAGDLTGYRTEQAYQFFDNGNILDSLNEWADIAVCDFEIVYGADGRSRTFTIYPGTKGSTKPELAIEMGSNLTEFSYDLDGQETATAVRILGTDEGCDNEVATAKDTSVFGLTLDAVFSVPVEFHVLDQMDRKAQHELARTKQLVAVPTFTTFEGVGRRLLGVLGLGDVIPVRVALGWVQESVNKRVVSMTWTPTTDQLAVGTNEEPDAQQVTGTYGGYSGGY